MEDANYNLVIGSITKDFIYVSIGFKEKILKVVLGKKESQAFILLENCTYIYRVFIDEFMNGSWTDSTLTKLQVSMPKTG